MIRTQISRLGFLFYYNYFWHGNKQKILPFVGNFHFLFFYLVYPGFDYCMLLMPNQHFAISFNLKLHQV
jgi:hypothetical protein